ncbi:restriction endonuclease [Bacillus sp. FJAT-50079]|uniref:restriction endonuclease n=1 Tax=Bacillus sp. FJAT-50079 TaxID=2833577 RepID=UPI001BC8D46D|nr:restriction endonuclease [Bacillus sp. FJAT-50079]MBS4207524.1 restriction endonuclease [Bacillus sp. FJAT-50079]
MNEQLSASDELKKTLAMGIYFRFKKEDEEAEYSSAFIKEDPPFFKNFIDDVIERVRGGVTWGLPPNGDFEVGFEDNTKEGKFLGRVKCHKEDLAIDPIALIHSNIVKRNAIGGYVVTTSLFTPATSKYEEGLNVELIDGVTLVELWLEGLQEQQD